MTVDRRHKELSRFAASMLVILTESLGVPARLFEEAERARSAALRLRFELEMERAAHGRNGHI